VNARLALDLIGLPKNLGAHPESGEPVDVGIGRYGPYVKHQRTYASLPKDLFVLDVTYEQALELLAKKAQRGGGALRELGTDPTSGDVVDVREGRYGPYVKRGKVNASLPKDLSPDDVTLEQAIELLDARAAAAPRTATRGSGTKKAGAKKASGKTASKPGPKAGSKEGTAKKAGAKTAATKTSGTKTTATKTTATKKPPTPKATTTTAKAPRSSSPARSTKRAPTGAATSED
jgi:DNA topoisomerase-1